MTRNKNLLTLLVIALAFLYIPFKIISYGWLPDDDALRHVPFATLDCKWSKILVIDDKFDTDHNAGWHQILRFLHHKLGFSQDGLLRFSVIGTFLLVLYAGIIVSPTPTAWLLAILSILIFDFSFLGRMLHGRPYMISCAVTLFILRLWALPKSNEEFKNKQVVRIITSTILFALATWIHGTWYIFLMIPFSFAIAGKYRDALKLMLCIFLGTLLGAAMTGHFVDFLSYHFQATTNIYGEKTFNWLLVSENASGVQNIFCIPCIFLVALLAFYKKTLTFKDLTNDPTFILMLLSWLLSILVIRFWIDWGRMALLFWMAYRYHDILQNSQSLKEPRVSINLFIFAILTLIFMTTNDGQGRFSKAVFDIPIDFSEERLKGWAPESGGIVYSDNMEVFYKHFYAYPNAPWKYILGFESAIMKPEDKKILRRIGYNFRLPEEFLPWINKMTKADRLITVGSVGDFPQLESIRGARNYWIYRLKTATDTADIASATSCIASDTATIATDTINTTAINVK